MQARAKKIVLLGDPVAHSVSPAIHNDALQRVGSSFTYSAERVSATELTGAVARLRSGDYRGANITIPHKVAALDMVDEVSAEAAAVGAINTVVCSMSGDKVLLTGHNTDVKGFLLPLEDPEGEVVVFGTGGSARAVVYALSLVSRISRVTVLSRNLERAARFADGFRFDNLVLNAATYGCAREYVREANLIVNATPLGMHPQDDTTPWTWADKPRSGAVAYDLVYTPRETRFMREASQRGMSTIGGLGMLVGQAALGFEMWTGKKMDTERAFSVADLHLQKTVPNAT